MNENFLSLTEAEQHTGKSRSSLRRFVESITKVENHADRHHLRPTVEELAVLKATNHPFSWLISEALLDLAFPKQGTHGQSSPDAGLSTSSDLIRVLEKSIALLESELNEKNKQIAQFLERQHETNILHKQTTEKLMMLSSGPRSRDTDEAVTVETSTQRQERDIRGKKKKHTPRKRMSFWQRLHQPIF